MCPRRYLWPNLSLFVKLHEKGQSGRIRLLVKTSESVQIGNSSHLSQGVKNSLVFRSHMGLRRSFHTAPPTSANAARWAPATLPATPKPEVPGHASIEAASQGGEPPPTQTIVHTNNGETTPPPTNTVAAGRIQRHRKCPHGGHANPSGAHPTTPGEQPHSHGGHTKPRGPATPPRRPHQPKETGHAPTAATRSAGERSRPYGGNTKPVGSARPTPATRSPGDRPLPRGGHT